MKLKPEFKETFEINEDITVWDLVRIMYENNLMVRDIFVVRYQKKLRG